MQRPLTRHATVILSVIAVAVLAWPVAATARNASAGAERASTTSAAVASQADSVERGDRGPTVGFWQDRLNVWFGLSGSGTRLVVDGIFGRLTEAATLEFQRSVDGLAADGVVDQVDRVALEDAIEALEAGGPGGRNVLVYFLDGEVLAVGGRTVDTATVATAAMEALLDGPAAGFEEDLAWGTAIPQGTELNGVVISNGTATVDLSSEYESGGGTASVTARLAQVVFTLTQFSTVDEVDVEIDGQPRESITGEGVPSQDLGRDDFLNQSNFGAPIPAILVESPFVGESVGGSLRLAGLSNTFEGTVNYEVTDPDGLIVVDESFTTASGGSGVWGRFQTVIDLPDFDRDGVASVFVYELSAQDGSRQFLVEIPIRVKAPG